MNNNTETEITNNKLPEYIKEAPWYFPNKENLEHLRFSSFSKPEDTSIELETKTIKIKEKKISIYKTGCCENCGSNTHTKFECIERPKKNNAKALGYGINEKDNKIEKPKSYAAKHDSFSTYSSSRWFLETSQRFSHQDQMLLNSSKKVDNNPKFGEEFGNKGFRDRNTIPDYIKYIDSQIPININTEDNFIKSENKILLTNSKISWEMDDKNRKQIKEELESKNIIQKKKREFEETLLLTEKLSQIELQILEEIPKSKKYGHLEDIYINGHTSVWGSYFNEGKWGYLCCKQTIKNCICNCINEKKNTFLLKN